MSSIQQRRVCGLVLFIHAVPLVIWSQTTRIHKAILEAWKNNSKLCAIWRIFFGRDKLISRIGKYIFPYGYIKWILSIWFDGIVVLVVNSKKRCWSMLLAGKSSGGNIFRLHTSSSFDVLPHMSFSPMRAPTLYSCVLHVPTRIRNWHLFGSSSLIFRLGRVWMEPIYPSLQCLFCL